MKAEDEKNKKKSYTARELCKFVIPSLFGVLIFLIPIRWNGQMTILIGVITDVMQTVLKPVISEIVLAAVVISGTLSVITAALKPKAIINHPRRAKLFVCNRFYLICRVLGAIIACMVYFQIGPEMICSKDTGGTMYSLVEIITVWFMAASFLIPLLMDFGIMDYVGTLVRNVTRPLFHLPGRAAVDLLASWLGSNNVGVVLTIKQYESGYYTVREAIVISCCFSAVSLPFSLVIAAMIHVEQLFVPFYLIVTITGFVCAAVMVRIPPLSLCPDDYCPDTGKIVNEQEPKEYTRGRWALEKAVEKAADAPDVRTLLSKGTDMFLGIVLQSAPVVIAFGTAACMIANYTPVFQWLSVPFGAYLDVLGIEEAFEVAPAAIIGFVDMFLPAVLLANVASLKTRFVLGALSLVQIVYITEIGTLLVTSKIPVKFRTLFFIFLEKTILALPMIVLLTNLVKVA